MLISHVEHIFQLFHISWDLSGSQMHLEPVEMFFHSVDVQMSLFHTLLSLMCLPDTETFSLSLVHSPESITNSMYNSTSSFHRFHASARFRASILNFSDARSLSIYPRKRTWF